jgi:hypothetical protein
LGLLSKLSAKVSEHPASNLGVCCAVIITTIIADRLASDQDVSFMRARSANQLYLHFWARGDVTHFDFSNLRKSRTRDNVVVEIGV